MTQIGKAAEWVYRFCFREAVANKKKAMPSPALCKFMRFLGLLLDVVPRKLNYYVHNRLLLFIDAFSFVH